MLNQTLLGECLAVLKTLPDESASSCVTDPPQALAPSEPTAEEIVSYVLRDDSWQVPSIAVWRECFRVLKPGAHLLSFGGPSTFDLFALGLRIAGFECRDSIASHHIGPSWEPVWVFRKPLAESTVTKQVLATGTGALNIDACRVSLRGIEDHTTAGVRASRIYASNVPATPHFPNPLQAERAERGLNPRYSPSGRWPSNLVLSHSEHCRIAGAEPELYICATGCPAAALDEQSGVSVSKAAHRGRALSSPGSITGFGRSRDYESTVRGHDDAGGASRFFSCFETEGAGRSLNLMRYLVKLVTPQGGTVLDPYCSGAIRGAALQEGFDFIGVEYFGVAGRGDSKPDPAWRLLRDAQDAPG